MINNKMIPSEVTGIILAGGKSSRMGEDKSLLRLNGKTLIEYAIETVKPFCKEVIISSNHSDYRFTGCQVWPDEIDHQAPLIGIYSCLKRSSTEMNIILSCDIPLINSGLIEFLLNASRDYDVTVPVHDNDQMEPLCGVYNKAATDRMKAAIDAGNFSIRDCIRQSTHRLIAIDESLPFYSTDLFLNINTQADYLTLISRFALPE